MWGSPSPSEEDAERAFHDRRGDPLGKVEGSFAARSSSSSVDFPERGPARVTRSDRGRAIGEEGPFWEGDDGSGSFPPNPSSLRKGTMAQNVLAKGGIGSHSEIRGEEGRYSLDKSRGRGPSSAESISTPKETIFC